jgi:hypothetical protein
MKKTLTLLMGICLWVSANGQDEGTIIKKERIERNLGISLGAGPSLTFGKNIGDYSSGFSLELGFVKRLNRVLSIGPSISYISFKYDPDVTSVNGGAYVGEGDPNDWGTKYGLNNLEYDYGYILTLKGGDISMISAALNLKLNFIPVRDNSKISVYGFVKPFIAMSSRKEVSGSDVRYTYEIYEDDNNTSTTNDDILNYNLGDRDWYEDGFESEWGAESYPALAEETSITGGLYVGPGIEFMPARAVSIFVQASFGYTFPISFISTKAYEPTVDDYVEEEFPMVKKGFPSLNLQAGLTFNF